MSEPAIGVKLNSENKIDIFLNLPKVNSREEMEAIAKEFAFMIINCYKADIMAYIQTSISNYGVKNNVEKFTSLILIYINKMLNPDKPQQKRPLVPPRRVFQVRGDMKND